MSSFVDSPRLPVIDLSLFDLGNPWRDHVAAQIDWAASEFGLFHVVGHGIEPGIADSLREQGAAFYRRAPETNPRAHLYFGEGLAEDHARADAPSRVPARPTIRPMTILRSQAFAKLSWITSAR